MLLKVCSALLSDITGLSTISNFLLYTLSPDFHFQSKGHFNHYTITKILFIDDPFAYFEVRQVDITLFKFHVSKANLINHYYQKRCLQMTPFVYLRYQICCYLVQVPQFYRMTNYLFSADFHFKNKRKYTKSLLAKTLFIGDSFCLLQI